MNGKINARTIKIVQTIIRVVKPYFLALIHPQIKVKMLQKIPKAHGEYGNIANENDPYQENRGKSMDMHGFFPYTM